MQSELHPSTSVLAPAHATDTDGIPKHTITLPKGWLGYPTERIIVVPEECVAKDSGYQIEPVQTACEYSLGILWFVSWEPIVAVVYDNMYENTLLLSDACCLVLFSVTLLFSLTFCMLYSWMESRKYNASQIVTISWIVVIIVLVLGSIAGFAIGCKVQACHVRTWTRIHVACNFWFVVCSIAAFAGKYCLVVI